MSPDEKTLQGHDQPVENDETQPAGGLESIEIQISETPSQEIRVVDPATLADSQDQAESTDIPADEAQAIEMPADAPVPEAVDPADVQPRMQPVPAASPVDDPPGIQPPLVTLAPDAAGPEVPLPMPGGPGSRPAPFDPQQASMWQQLAQEYEREREAAEDPQTKAALLYATGQIWEEKLAQPRNAWQCYNQAFQLDAQLLPNIRAARRLAAEVGNWNVAIQILESEIEATREPRKLARIYHRKGLILEEKLGRHDEARESFETALRIDPGNLEILRQLERMSITAGDWSAVLNFRTRQLQLISDPDVVTNLLASSAQIYQQYFNDEATAEEFLRQAWELKPGSPSVARLLEQNYIKNRRIEPLERLLVFQAEHCSDPATCADLYYRIARLNREQIGDNERALEMLRKALQLTPENNSLLSEMAQICENLMRWQELVEIYEKQVEQISDRQELVSLNFKMGNIWEERLFSEEKAIACYQRVVDLDPAYLPAMQALGKLFYRKGKWDELARMFEIEIRQPQDNRQRATRMYKLAEILEERLGRDDEAMQKYAECLETYPGFLPALKALGRLYTKYSRWESLIGMYENELESTRDHDQQVFLLDKIGTMWEEKLSNIDKAIATYQRILEISPDYIPAIRNLGKLFVRADRWEELIRINEMEAELINDQKQVISLLHRNGEILEEKLNEKDRAIEAYMQVLTLAPSYLPALQSLGRLYFIKGRWDDLITMYRQEIEVTESPSQQVALLYKIGELYEEKLVQEDRAIATYREVLQIQPSNLPALKSLARIYTNKSDWENLLEILRMEADATDDPEQKADRLFVTADIWEQQLGNTEQAIALLQEILRLMPHHQPATKSLIRLHTHTQAWRELLNVLEQEMDREHRPARQVSLLEQMAEIHASKLNDLAQAVSLYERILNIQSDHLTALEALERIYLTQREHHKLLKVYEQIAEQTRDPQLKLSIHSQIADLKENRIDPPLNSGSNYIQMLSVESDHSEAIRALDMLYHRFGTWPGLRALYERELSRTRNPSEAIDLCLRIADLAEHRLGQPQIALHYYQQALNLSPECLPAIKGLKRIYAAQGNNQAMSELLDAEGRATQDADRAVAILKEAGQLHETEFNDPDRARAIYQQVLQRNGRDLEAFAKLESLHIQAADWEQLVALYQKRLQLTEQEHELTDLFMKLGDLFRNKLQRMQDAAESYTAVLRTNPSHLMALAGLAEISYQAQSWDAALDYSTRVLDLTGDPALLAATHHRMGIIYQEKQPNVDKAISHYRSVIELQPDSLDAMARLKTIYITRQRWDEAVEILSRLTEKDPEQRREHQLELARILETGLEQPDKAIEVMQQLVVGKPDDIPVLASLSRLLEKRERWSEFAGVYRAWIAQLPAEAMDERIAAHMRLGQVLAEQLIDTDKAIIEYKQVLQLQPDNQPAQEALARLYGGSGVFYANAIDMHRTLLAADPFRLQSYREMRRIFEEQRAPDKVFCVCSVLHYLRSADQNEEFFYGEHKDKAPELSTEQLTSEEVERQLVHPNEHGLIRDILKIVGAHLSKVVPGDLAHHGVGRSSRTRPDDPVRKLADRLSANLGEVEFDLFLSSQPNHQVAIENASPIAMVVGESLIKRTVVKEQRFAIARALKRIWDGSFLATSLGAQGLAQLIAAIIHPFAPESPLVTATTNLDEDLTKKVFKALPRKARKALDDLTSQRTDEMSTRPDYDAYLRAVEHSANRAGLLFCNDLNNAIMHISRELPELDGKRLNATEEIVAHMRNQPRVCELIRYSVSEEYFNLRKRLRLAISD